MSQRALITGIAGFAGGFLAEHLLDCGDAVLGCSLDGRWEEDSAETIRDRVELVPWNLADPAGPGAQARRSIDQFRPSAIYHLAAMSVPKHCGLERIAPEAIAVNVEGTRRVLELAAALASRPRVLLVSSSHVYAPVRPESPRVQEGAPLGPGHGYGLTKLRAEELVRRAVARDGLDALIARAFQHSGPRQVAPLMLSQWARQFAEASPKPVEVYTLDAWIDLSDVRDVVRAYRLLVEHGRPGQIYNVGSGLARRTGDIFAILRQMADPRRPVVELSPGFKQDPVADITRLVRATGWRPEVPLEQTIADTLAYWRERNLKTQSPRPKSKIQDPTSDL